MSIDTEYISEKDFNSKFKNYFRDFYIYQFKNKDVDFYNKGTFLKSRMICISILSFISGKSLEELLYLRMKDIVIENDFVSVCIDDKNDNGFTLEKPLCEMFKYLYTPEKAAYFLTGNTGAPNLEKLKIEYESFYKTCTSPKTIEKMYRFWGQVYLDEANETIKNSTYRNDSLRVQALVRKMAGVTWKYGSKVDYAKSCLGDRDDKCVECITVDSRILTENPFHTLYQYCNRVNVDKKTMHKDFFAMLYALLMYFYIGEKINCCNNNELSVVRLRSFDNYLKEMAANAFNSKNKDHRGGNDNAWKNWDQLTEKQKLRYATKIPSQFINESFNKMICDAYNKNYKKNWTWDLIKDSEDISDFIYEVLSNNREQLSANYLDVFAYLIINRKTIIYTGEKFAIQTYDCIEKRLLYIALSRFVSCGERQFTNVMKELTKIGIFNEKKELILQGKRVFNVEEKDNREKIVELLSNFKEISFELAETIGHNTLALRFDSKTQGKQLQEIKEKISSLGIETKNSDKFYYCLSNKILKNVLADDVDLTYRFKEMVSFFSQTTALGEIGSFIKKHIPTASTESSIQFNYKHNYIVNALNDYNLIDLLNAIKNGKWIDIECRSPLSEHEYQHFVCFPIEVRENVFNGKQYLIYYHPAYRSIASVTIDSIDSIRVGEYKKKTYYFFDADIKRAERLIKYTWGNKFDGFFEGNVKADIKPSKVKIVVTFNKNNEKFIRNRIKREVPNGTLKETYLDKNIVNAEIVAELINPIDMLHWVRSYTTRIVSFEILYNGFVDEAMRTYKMYQIPSQQIISLSLCETPKDVIESIDADFQAEDDIHSQLFNEIYSISFFKLGDILFDILHSKQTDENFAESKKKEYLNAFTFDDTKKSIQVKKKREQQIDGFLKNFIFNNKPVFSASERNGFDSIKSLLPLTKIEIQWLNNILQHPFATCFLDDNEIRKLRNWLTTDELFDINDIVLVGQALDIKEYYEKSSFSDNLRMILQAIRNNYCLNVNCITQYGTPKNYENFAPVYIEYSKKDGRFRIRGVGDKRIVETINLERIVSVSSAVKTFNRQEIAKAVSEDDKNKEEHLVIFFSDIDNVPNKILSEFSCYRKECIRWGNGKYRMVLYYNSDDYKEIIIRLLGYGSLITVSEDTGNVLSELKERLANQLILSKMLNKSKDIEELDVEHES